MSHEAVLVVNPGSSSLKLGVLDSADRVVAEGGSGAGGSIATEIEKFLVAAPPVDAAGVRVVHGGSEFTHSVLVDDMVESRLAGLVDLAPLHAPLALATMDALQCLRPRLPTVACFDTAFHQSLAPAAATYALPWAWTVEWGIRRFGFHGFSHAYATRRAAELLGRPPSELRLVTCHLGAGASLAAVAGGRSVDTTMGFTPVEGLAMATRSGSVDPGALLWVQRHAGLSVGDAERALGEESGLLGISGVSGDIREVLAAAEEGAERAELALSVYIHRLRAGIAAMVAAMGDVDALVFTGGVGEHSAWARRQACSGLRFLGVALDDARNEDPGTADVDLSRPEAATRTLVVRAREDIEIARSVRQALTANGAD